LFVAGEEAGFKIRKGTEARNKNPDGKRFLDLLGSKSKPSQKKHRNFFENESYIACQKQFRRILPRLNSLPRIQMSTFSAIGQAGVLHRMCKHKQALIDGNVEMLFDPNQVRFFQKSVLGLNSKIFKSILKLFQSN